MIRCRSTNTEPEGERAYATAVRLLGRRDQSIAELRSKLALRGFQPEAVEEVLDRLERVGYLNDRRYAVNWVSAAMRSGRGVGVKLKLELQRRGISEEVIGEALEQLAGHHEERDLLAQLAERRFAGFDPAMASERDLRRVYGFFQRRGFRLNTIISYFRENTE